MPIEDIRAFLMLPGPIGTSGMPTAQQFTDIAQAGFRGVINLALPTSDNALPNEGDLVTRAGMAYIHIPVLFDAPKPSDYEQFERMMNARRPQPLFVHCAANMRVSAFVFLYRLRNNLAARDAAESDLRKIWDPDGVWRDFINANLPSGEKPI
jgi:protein tyrosine phosphatase (PTP) superfamily phosphohydrolase (DUF442 family)